MPSVILLFGYVLLTMVTTTRADTSPITCLAGEFEAGRTAVVSCNFAVDLKAEKAAAFSLSYSNSLFGKDDRVTSIPIACNFVGKLDDYRCNHLQGYIFDPDAHKEFIVVNIQIPMIDAKHVGRYSCHVTDERHKDRTRNSCNLTIHDQHGKSQKGEVTPLQPCDCPKQDCFDYTNRETIIKEVTTMRFFVIANFLLSISFGIKMLVSTCKRKTVTVPRRPRRGFAFAATAGSSASLISSTSLNQRL